MRAQGEMQPVRFHNYKPDRYFVVQIGGGYTRIAFASLCQAAEFVRLAEDSLGEFEGFGREPRLLVTPKIELVSDNKPYETEAERKLRDQREQDAAEAEAKAADLERQLNSYKVTTAHRENELKLLRCKLAELEAAKEG